MWDWIQRNVFTKKVLGVVIGASGVFYPPLLPLTTTIGGVIFGSDFQHGAALGTPIGQAAKDMVKQVRDVLPQKSGVIVMGPK